MTIEEALAELEDSIKGAGYQCHIETYKMAIAALRAQQEREKNEPLTLEELRGMVGNPIVIDNCWFFLEKIEDGKAYCYRWYYDFADEIDIDEYGKTWFAYRYMPMGENENV